MDKTLQFFMFFCLSVVNVGGRGGGGYLDYSGRPSVCCIISKMDFPMENPVKNKHRDRYK